MKKLTPLLTLFALFAGIVHAADYSVQSPDGRLQAVLKSDKEISFSLLYKGKPLFENAKIAMNTDKGSLGEKSELKSVKSVSCDSEIEVPFGIVSKLRDNYNQIDADFGTFKIIFRAYNDAVAYRIVSNLGKEKMRVFSETLDINLPEKTPIIGMLENNAMSSYERLFSRINSSENDKQLLLPVIVKTKEASFAVVESDVNSYPMLRFKVKDGLKSTFVKHPKNLVKASNFMVKHGEFDDFTAQTDATRSFPWRAFVVAENDADFSVNNTVFKLAEPSRLSDTSWITTGTCSWEWWNNWSLENVDFKTGVNEETYIRYIDFAAKYKIPYILFDAGWLVGEDVGKMGSDVHEMAISGKPFLNVKKLIGYAHKKNVKVVLWCLGQSLNLYGEKAIPLMKSWGADGLKIDFFDRDDQTAMDLYYRLAQIAADNKMVIDFHGCAKPAGLNRTFPNVINFEGVLGLEMNKSKRQPATPSHNVDLVMTRMLQGPMDYTPGAINNVKEKYYTHNSDSPASIGTRAHQGALYTLFYAPLQMLCDSPTQYEKYPQFTSFIASTPTTWDDSKPLCAKLGEYVVVARKKGEIWYIAGICAGKEKEIQLDLSKFMPNKSYAIEAMLDSINADKTPTDAKIGKIDAPKDGKLTVKMVKDGGFVIKLIPLKGFSKFVNQIF